MLTSCLSWNERGAGKHLHSVDLLVVKPETVCVCERGEGERERLYGTHFHVRHCKSNKDKIQRLFQISTVDTKTSSLLLWKSPDRHIKTRLNREQHQVTVIPFSSLSILEIRVWCVQRRQKKKIIEHEFQFRQNILGGTLIATFSIPQYPLSYPLSVKLWEYKAAIVNVSFRLYCNDNPVLSPTRTECTFTSWCQL